MGGLSALSASTLSGDMDSAFTGFVTRVRQTEASLASALQDFRDADAERTRIRGERDTARNDLIAEQTKKAQAERDRDAARQQIADLVSRTGLADLTAIEAEITRLRTQGGTAIADLATRTTERDAARQATADFVKRVNTAASTSFADLTAVEAEIARLRSAETTLTTERNTAIAERDAANRALRDLEARLQEMSAASGQLIEARATIESLQSDRLGTVQALEAAQTELHSLRAQLEEKKTPAAAATAQRETSRIVKTEVHSLRAPQLEEKKTPAAVATAQSETSRIMKAAIYGAVGSAGFRDMDVPATAENNMKRLFSTSSELAAYYQTAHAGTLAPFEILMGLVGQAGAPSYAVESILSAFHRSMMTALGFSQETGGEDTDGGLF